MQQPTHEVRRPSLDALTNFALGVSAVGIILFDLDAPHAGRAWIALCLVVLLVIRLWGAE